MTIQATKAHLPSLPNPFGPYRGADWEVDISGGDYEDASGFTVQAVQAGDLTFRTVLQGPEGTDQTLTLAAGGSVVGPGGVAVACIAVRQNATITQINVGFP